MNRAASRVPVILGGAALTRAYVEQDLRARLSTARSTTRNDAFEGLSIVGRICEQARRGVPVAARAAAAGASAGATTSVLEPAPAAAPVLDDQHGRDERELAAAGVADSERPRAFSIRERPVPRDEAHEPATTLASVAVPDAPFFGTRVLEDVPLKSIVPFVNERLLFQFQWGFRRGTKSEAQWQALVDEHARPAYRELLERCAKEKILQPKAVYGLFPCQSVGETVVIYDETATRELARLWFPRQPRGPRRGIADFFRPISSGEKDVIGLQLVTVGREASDVARAWFRANRYRDYLYLHGLSVEMAEALAEYVHRQIRSDLAIAGDDAREMSKLLHQGYRGSRYSFGYPACPDLSMQAVLNRLLRADRIGVTLSEEYQLEPEQSTSAIVVHHPDAKYFSVG